MNIKIDEIHNKIQIDLNPNDYFLVKAEDNFNGDYALAHRIDMSYKEKPDQEGSPLIYLTEKEADKIRGLVDEIATNSNFY